MHYYGYNNGYDIIGFVFMIIILAAIIVGIVMAIRYLAHGTGSNGAAAAALHDTAL